MEDDEPFDVELPRRVKQLEEHFAESARLEAVIRRNLEELKPSE